MIAIRPIQTQEWTAAKRVVYRVAHEIFNDKRSLEEAIAYYEARGELKDMDDIQKNYFEARGTFLVMLMDSELIGTGAIRKLREDICELKRLWLLTEHHGKGLGYLMIQELFSFARGSGYKRIWLQTDATYQSRALEFYKRLGFDEIPRYSDRTDDISMELVL
jgi:putative acetyltransferase